PSRAPRSARGTRRRCSSRRRSSRRARQAPCRHRPRGRTRTPPAPDCRARHRRLTASPSRLGADDRVELVRHFLIRMRGKQRTNDVTRDLSRHYGLDAEFRNALLPTHLADRRIRALARHERAGARRVPRAALVVADAARARSEDCGTRRLECVLRDEPHELPPRRLGHGQRLVTPHTHRGESERILRDPQPRVASCFSFAAASDATAMWIAVASRMYAIAFAAVRRARTNWNAGACRALP